MTVTETSKSLAESARNWLRGQLSAGLFSFTILSTPHPKPSPRVARGGGSVFFSGKGYNQFRGDCQRESAKWPIKGHSGQLAVIMECVLPRSKVTKFASPLGDVDNYAKVVLDSMKSSGVYLDDRQVELLVSTKRWAELGEEPHVNISIGEL